MRSMEKTSRSATLTWISQKGGGKSAAYLLLTTNLHIMSRGTTTIKKSSLSFVEILEIDNFCQQKKKAKDLSDFESSMLILIGNAIRGRNSQHFWLNGAYSWYRDERQEKIDRVWLTKNGIAVFEQETNDGQYKYFRASFDF